MSVEDRLTCEQRLQKCPAGVDMPGKPPCILLDQSDWEQTLSFENGRYLGASGAHVYWETITPVDKSKIERVIVFFHGFTDNIGWLTRNTMLVHAYNSNSAVIGFDLPGHGRSDGLHLYINSWDEFVDVAVDFVQNFGLEKREEWNQLTKRTGGLRLFGHGESMGGGVLVSIAIKHPELFEGLVLVAPMIYIGENAKPPWIIVWLLSGVANWFPTAAMLPGKDLSVLSWSDAETRTQVQGSPLGGGTEPLRLQTAVQLLEATKWMSTRLREVQTPFIVMHAKDDAVTESSSSVKLHEEAAATDKELKLYEDSMHAELLHGGPTKRALVETVFADAAAWMSARSDRSV